MTARAHSNRVLPKTLIGEYFRAVKEKYAMLSIGDIHCYAEVFLMGFVKVIL